MMDAVIRDQRLACDVFVFPSLAFGRRRAACRFGGLFSRVLLNLDAIKVQQCYISTGSLLGAHHGPCMGLSSLIMVIMVMLWKDLARRNKLLEREGGSVRGKYWFRTRHPSQPPLPPSIAVDKTMRTLLEPQVSRTNLDTPYPPNPKSFLSRPLPRPKLASFGGILQGVLYLLGVLKDRKFLFLGYNWSKKKRRNRGGVCMAFASRFLFVHSKPPPHTYVPNPTRSLAQ